jgi:predicted ATPase
MVEEMVSASELRLLSKLITKNYKSLADFEMDFGKFNVLIGPNNTGKSNILDCLSFLSETMDMDLGAVIRKRGGYDHIVFGGKEEKEVRMNIVASIDSKEFNYEISFWKKGIIEERLTLKGKEEERVILEGTEGKGKYLDEVKGKEEEYSYGTATSAFRYLRDTKRTPTVMKFYEYAKNWRFYSFVPATMRTALPVERRIVVDRSGEWLAQVLHTILSDRSPFYDEIEDVLKIAIKEIERLLSPLTEDKRTYVAIKEKYFERPFDYIQLSDGTLCFLAHLAVLFNPNPPSLVCFEEPENHIHPSLFEFLVKICKRAETQVIISTHAPRLVDWVESGDIKWMEKEEGMTKLRALDKEKLKKALEEEVPLGELLF